MKTTMIATAARQRPRKRSSRAVRSRSAIAPPLGHYAGMILRAGVAKITQRKNKCRSMPMVAASRAAVDAAADERGAALSPMFVLHVVPGTSFRVASAEQQPSSPSCLRLSNRNQTSSQMERHHRLTAPTVRLPRLRSIKLAGSSRRASVKVPNLPGGPALFKTVSKPVPASETWATLTALDLMIGGRVLWQVKTPKPLVGGTLATAGGLVFTGGASGHFGAYDAATGAARWAGGRERPSARVRRKSGATSFPTKSLPATIFFGRTRRDFGGEQVRSTAISASNPTAVEAADWVGAGHCRGYCSRVRRHGTV
jgi:hypothetical protein